MCSDSRHNKGGAMHDPFDAGAEQQRTIHLHEETPVARSMISERATGSLPVGALTRAKNFLREVYDRVYLRDLM